MAPEGAEFLATVTGMPVDRAIQRLLDAIAANPRPVDSLTPEQLRGMWINFAAAGGSGPEMAEERDLPNTPVRMRLYRPEGATGAVVLWIHGGGFVIGGVDSYHHVCRLLAHRSGAAVVSVEYRLAPEHPFPAAVDDCLAALDWLSAHAADIGADPSRLGVAGDSAGGNLAAVCALVARDGGPRVRYQLLVYPRVDSRYDYPSIIENSEGYFLTLETMKWFANHYTGGEGTASPDWRIAPIQATSHAGLPPAFVVTAEFDPLRDEGERYAEVLRAAGVDAVAKRYDGVIHGFFGMEQSWPVARAAMDDAAAALRVGLSG